MRLWSINPSYLDPQGLVALWREGLLAQKVLRGQTKGYKNHPQLIRFKETSFPLDTINAYLLAVCDEAKKRGYSFDSAKLNSPHSVHPEHQIAVTRGQINYEWNHLLKKLSVRSPELYDTLRTIKSPHPHPLFFITQGEVSPWEKVS